MTYNLIKPINNSYSPKEQILTNRGIPIHKINNYLNTSEKDVHNPLLLDNMRQGAQMLIQHIIIKP